MAIVLALVLMALGIVVAGEWLRGATIGAPSGSIIFLLFVVIPFVQIIPIPSSSRVAVDPGGATLLENAPGGLPRTWPISLDPTSTREEIGTAAAALVVFLVAAHVAGGRRHRKLVLQGIALAGLVGAVLGLAHRIFSIEQLFGMFNVSGSVLPGPFINPNHSAEFYELVAFTALALAFDSEREVRVVWSIAACVSAGCALATLSRGSFLGLVAGGVTFVLLRVRGNDAEPGPNRLRQTMVWTAVAVAGLVAVALAFGASPLWDEVAKTNLTGSTEKLIVWKDSLPIVQHHPWGIGRHAFDRVYPAYKTLPQDIRFQFIEDGPLQLLVDTGWWGFASLLVAGVLFFRKSTWRRDDLGAALAGALIAVSTHNVFDFGLETMGIRLPFAAIAGVAIGRSRGRQSSGSDEKKKSGLNLKFMDVAVTAVAFVGLLFGLGAQWRQSAEKVEARWKAAPSAEKRREIAIEGGRLFPTDFYFPLLQSFDESANAHEGVGPSPRLRALNRSLRLCPTCSFVHEQVGRVLLQLGLRKQALSSYRDTIRLKPGRLLPILGLLDARGYSAADLATLAEGDGDVLMEAARYLVPKKAELQVTNLLVQAGEKGVPEVDRSLVQADLAVALGQLARARALLESASRSAVRDGRPHLALADIFQREGRLDLALEQARIAAASSAFDIGFARRRLALVIEVQQWSELDDALEHLKVALRQQGLNVAEVHLAAGQAYERRRNLTRALSEYRLAATLDATSVPAWMAVAQTCHAVGNLETALEAYQRASALHPEDASIRQTIASVRKERTDARLQDLLR